MMTKTGKRMVSRVQCNFSAGLLSILLLSCLRLIHSTEGRHVDIESEEPLQVNLTKNNNDSSVSSPDDVRITSIRTKELPKHLLVSLPRINNNANTTKDLMINSTILLNNNGNSSSNNDDINNQTTGKSETRASNNTTASSSSHSLDSQSSGRSPFGHHPDSGVNRRNLEASLDSSEGGSVASGSTLSLPARPESSDEEESTSQASDEVIRMPKLTVWQRIGLAPGLTGLSIVSAILVYFVVWAGNRTEHTYLFFTILLAGFGNLGAGFILSQVQNWKVFIRVSELLVLEPTLLGLKGNIEMCMASRLSTQANLGNMDSWKSTFKMIRGNLALDLAQATTVATVASIGVVVFSLIQSATHRDDFVYSLYIVLSSCLATACTASVLLGSLLVTVIVVSYKLKMDPDNIGSPVAASMGDVITLSLLAFYANQIFNSTPPHDTGSSLYSFPVIPVGIITGFLCLLPIWFFIAWKNEYTRSSVPSGWIPIFIAVMLSTCSGFILDYATYDFVRYAVFQPVINGIGGNLVAVHSSRMSTALHKTSSLGDLPEGVKQFRSPFRAFFDKNGDANISMARNLVLMAIPAHVVYLFVTVVVKENTSMTVPFLLLYICAAVVQILLLLYVAYHLVNLMWKHGIDPDNTSIPILTATGDFLGSLFLLLSFLTLRFIGDTNAIS